MKSVKKIIATSTEIWTNLKFHANPTKENYLSTVYDIFQIDANSKKNIYLFFKSELGVLKSRVEGIKNSKERLTTHFFIEVMTNENCKKSFTKYLISDKKNSDLTGIVKQLEDILEKQNSDDVEEVNLDTKILRESEVKNNMEKESLSRDSKGNKSTGFDESNNIERINKVNQRAYLIAGEIYLRDILNNENRYKDLIRNNGFDNFILTNISDHYNKAGKHKRGSYREIVSAGIPKELGALKAPLNQIIENPQEFINKDLLEKSKVKDLQHKITDQAEKILQSLL